MISCPNCGDGVRYGSEHARGEARDSVTWICEQTRGQVVVPVPARAMELEDLVEGALYKNLKTGNIYKVLQIATHSETMEQLVVYHRDLGDHKKWWVRPVELFLTKFVPFQYKD